MAANYIAAYAAYQFVHRGRAENLISTIVNEMLETAVRLAPPPSDLQIQYAQFDDGLHLNLTHSIRDEAVTPYLTFLNELVPDDNICYLDLLTSERPQDNYFNQLGLTMLAHEFGARLTAQPETQPDRIQTQVFIPIEELSA
ncbi:MAG: hypothetical protein GY803_19825 [Chloroflexi bacterium]|nr:hypothetical protein [Chloroflexota bacterium]